MLERSGFMVSWVPYKILCLIRVSSVAKNAFTFRRRQNSPLAGGQDAEPKISDADAN